MQQLQYQNRFFCCRQSRRGESSTFLLAEDLRLESTWPVFVATVVASTDCDSDPLDVPYKCLYARRLTLR